MLQEAVLHGDSYGKNVRVSVSPQAGLLSCQSQQASAWVGLQMAQIPQTTDHSVWVSLEILVTGKAQGLWFCRK